MARHVALRFLTGDTKDTRRFLEYVLDALERGSRFDTRDSFTFVPEQATSGDRTTGFQVPPTRPKELLTIRGDVDEVTEAGREHWDSLVDDIVEEWETMKPTARSEMHAELGEEGARLLARRSELSAQMATLAYEAFDDLGTPRRRRNAGRTDRRGAVRVVGGPPHPHRLTQLLVQG